MKRKNEEAALARILKPELVSADKQPSLELVQQLVQQQVAEALVQRDGLLWEPWFRQRAVADEIRKLQTVQERKFWPIFFSVYGCFVCKTKDRMHAGNGCCTSCRSNRDRQVRRVHRLIETGKVDQA